MVATHPDFPNHPTLPELQAYVAAVLEYRKLNTTNPELNLLQLVEEVGELARAIRKTRGGKFASDTHTTEIAPEAADVFILLVGLCNMLDIDLLTAIQSKETHNKTRVWE